MADPLVSSNIVIAPEFFTTELLHYIFTLGIVINRDKINKTIIQKENVEQLCEIASLVLITLAYYYRIN